MKIAAFALALTIAIPAQSYALDGNDAHRLCKSPEDYKLIAGYVMGWLEKLRADEDTFALAASTTSGDARRHIEFYARQAGPGRCFPKNVTARQTTDEVCKFLNENAELRAEPMNNIMKYSLRRTWECPAVD